jgi:hypothetical protein
MSCEPWSKGKIQFLQADFGLPEAAWQSFEKKRSPLTLFFEI